MGGKWRQVGDTWRWEGPRACAHAGQKGVGEGGDGHWAPRRTRERRRLYASRVATAPSARCVLLPPGRALASSGDESRLSRPDAPSLAEPPSAAPAAPPKPPSMLPRRPPPAASPPGPPPNDPIRLCSEPRSRSPAPPPGPAVRALMARRSASVCSTLRREELMRSLEGCRAEALPGREPRAGAKGEDEVGGKKEEGYGG